MSYWWTIGELTPGSIPLMAYSFAVLPPLFLPPLPSPSPSSSAPPPPPPPPPLSFFKYFSMPSHYTSDDDTLLTLRTPSSFS